MFRSCQLLLCFVVPSKPSGGPPGGPTRYTNSGYLMGYTHIFRPRVFSRVVESSCDSKSQVMYDAVVVDNHARRNTDLKVHQFGALRVFRYSVVIGMMV
jgi:hypothetical protein